MPHIIFVRVDSLAYAEWAGSQGDELDKRQKQTGGTDPRKPIVPTAPNKTAAKKCQGNMAPRTTCSVFNIEWLSLKCLVWPGQLLVFVLLVTLAG